MGIITEVYRKPTDTGLLLHFQSHVDSRCKKVVVDAMANRAYRLSSTKEGLRVTHHVSKAALSDDRDGFHHISSARNQIMKYTPCLQQTHLFT